MSALLFVDVIGGAAGDMLLAALLDAGAPIAAVTEAVEAVLPGRFRLDVEAVRRGGYRAAHLRISDGPAAAPRRESRPAGELTSAVAAAALEPEVSERAVRVLEALVRAEGRVHGIDGPDLELHAAGEDDTLLDVVGVAAALHALGVDRVVVSSLPIGVGGTAPADAGHPDVPLPAPAALELLRGFDLRPGAGEAVTPTAAAVLGTLGEPSPTVPPMRLRAVGYGAGTRDPASHPNVVRVLLGDPAAGGPATDDEPSSRPLTVLETNLDDLSPELVADAAAALFAAGALDAWSTPVLMKKGRPGVVLSALCEPDREAAVRAAFFAATSTFGVRAHGVSRAELERRSVAVEVAGGTVRVKVGLLGGRVVTAAPEHDDAAALATQTGRAVREVYEAAAAAARALRQEDAPA